MTPTAANQFQELSAIAQRHGMRLHLAETPAQQKQGFAWADNGPASATVCWFNDLRDIEQYVAPLTETV